MAQHKSNDFETDQLTRKFSFWGSNTLTPIFIVTFALSVACNIYTVTFFKPPNVSNAVTAQLASELTPFGTHYERENQEFGLTFWTP